MFLETLFVRNWRGLKALQLQLQPGLNLIHGPNESGKSSLHQALRSAFLIKSKGKGSPTAAKPWSGSGSTSIEVKFRHQGERWRLTRVFFGNGSQLYREDKLVAKDDAVQAWLDEHLADRGLSALLSEQGDIKLADVPPALRPHLVAAETVTPGVAWLEVALRDRYELYWTPKTGAAKKGVSDARLASLQAEEEVDNVEEEMRASLRSAQEMESLQAESNELRQAQQAMMQQLDQQRPLLGAWETYRRQQAEKSNLQQQLQGLTGWLQRWDEQCQRALQLGPRLEDWKARQADLESKTATAPDRSAVESLQLRLQYAQARRQSLLNQEMAQIKAPSREQVKELEQLSQRQQALQQSLEAGAWEAELEALQPLTASLDGNPLQLAGGQKQSWKTAQGFTLELAGARLQLKAGGQTVQQAAECQLQLQNLLQRLGLNSAAEARQRLEQAQDLKALLQAGVPEASSLNYPEAAELDRLSRSELEEELRALPGRIAALENEARQARAQYDGHVKELQRLLQDNPQASMQACLESLRGLAAEKPELALSIEQSVPPPTAVDPLRRQQIALQEQVQGAPLHEPAGQEVSPASIQALEARLAESQRELEGKQERLNQILGALKEQRNLHDRLCLAQERLAKANQEQAKIELTAHSARLLWDSFQRARQELDKDIVGPLRQRLSGKIQRLTQARYAQVCMQPDFRAESLLTAQGETAPLTDLSFGTREQLAFLSRLCLAEMLSEQERNLVVFDDNLVHTDPQRHQLACAMLEEAAQSCQILLLSCHPERFLPHLPSAHVQELGR